MSDNTPAVLAARQIDVIGIAAMEAFASPESFEKELQVAQAVSNMRAVLTPEVMAPIMGLMNTGLGFDTDRNPAKTPFDKDGKPMTPYPMEVVREVFIESRLRGFHTVGNEFNIIAGKFYGCLNGFDRKVKTNPKVTDFKDTYSVPVMHGEKGAIVKASATWIQDGTKQSLEREFAVRVNAGMGADAVIGKAKRKLYAAVYGRLTGVVTPEGEAGDDVTEIKATAAPSEPSKLFGKPAEATVQTPPPAPPSAGEPVKKTVESREPKVESKPESAPETMRSALEHLMTSSGVKFDDFRDFCKTKNLAKDPDAWADWSQVPEKCGEWFNKNPKTAVECIKKFGNVQGK